MLVPEAQGHTVASISVIPDAGEDYGQQSLELDPL